MPGGLIVLVCAVPFEGDLIAGAMKRKKDLSGQLTACVKGKLAGRDVLLAFSRPGKTNAAITATPILERHSIEVLINFGIGGAFPGSGLHPGEIAVATEEIYGDEGVLLSNGFRSLRFMKLPILSRNGKNLYNHLPVSGHYLGSIMETLQGKGISCQKGPFVTLSTVTGTYERAVQLRRRFRCICENMEGAALAHLAVLKGVPFVEIRGISNMVGRRDRSAWKIKEATDTIQELLIDLIPRLD